MMKQPFYNNKQNQQGIALIAVVLIISIFTILGMMTVKKARDNERLAGSTVRYSTVFEAAEQTLRDASDYLLRIDGSPYVGNGSLGRATAENFNVATISVDDNNSRLVSNPNAAIVWDRKTLADAICGLNGCQSGVDFINRMDTNIWQNLAIKTRFDNGINCPNPSAQSVACNNYLHDIETYTFIEELNSGHGENGSGETAPQGKGRGPGGATKETRYLITVKASGYAPGIADNDITSINSRENVIVQGVFSRL